jgi:hypothetical protein
MEPNSGKQRNQTEKQFGEEQSHMHVQKTSTAECIIS